jgi:hypothetical protein
MEDLAVDGTVIITRILKNYGCRLYKVHVPQNVFQLRVSECGDESSGSIKDEGFFENRADACCWSQ